ncbi:hypothetical protein A6V36_02365 [Paraburkholderia ginsengiterrae]|uniref:Uncharacterized protein n=1 Tax=Paraburkholderia ginsengiterrae TaxID=1462993 RepID=A0A1A9NBX9_9BURK|nr:hypothetical protein A6V36_02365 [Paraburkholderia ginsengiterrae]OAJ64211.1 hypothetical protein A6V37_01565 [Paraburkholderia ginsengiterrae]
MCGIPQKAAATPFAGVPDEVLNKVIHRHAGRLQLFSRIQNLAQKLKFYFNFDRFLLGSLHTAVRPHAAITLFVDTAA